MTFRNVLFALPEWGQADPANVKSEEQILAEAALLNGRFDDPCAAFHFWSPHSGGSHFLFADGAVRFLAYSAAPLMPALATRAGEEAVELP